MMIKAALRGLAWIGLMIPAMLVAQNVQIDFESQHQLIRGFGGVNMPSWINDLSSEEVEKAFGVGEGQLGFSILRIKVPATQEGWAQEVATAKKAKEMGAILLATPWSAPAAMKTNNSLVAGELLAEFYDDYVQYLTDFCNYMAENGAELYAISIQNEPDYGVDYESCDWSSAQMIDFLKNHASTIPVRIVAPESFQFIRSLSDPILNDPEAAAEVDIIGGHIYGGGLFSYPLAQRKGKEVWMTEHLELETDWESVLATGKELHDCMLSEFNAYIWWYIRREYGPIGEEGQVSKRGFVMSHFSKFVRPGMYRVKTDASPAPRVSISAFRSLDHTVVVAINQNTEAQELTFELSGGEFGTMQRFETTADHNVVSMESVEIDENAVTVILPGSSITTFTGEMVSKTTFINPVLAGDHPDLTLLKHGNDFYLSGSNFHRAPFGTILHSKDLMHWKTIANVVPADWADLASDAPSDGTWQGVITYFYDSFWYYFSNNAGGGQYFCKADSPDGPWSDPVKLTGTASTGASGYDDSIFVDDDGTAYLLIKAGKFTNRMQQIGADGHLVGDAINLDWMNADSQYSWAEGPVMCKRDGWYYYFVAGNVGGGQWVLRSQTLSADPENWEELGEFFEPITDSNTGFRGPNHITAPVELHDGTWWTLSHSYERIGNDDWSALGRQGLLHQIIWDENGIPTGSAPVSVAVAGPNLLNAGIPKKTTISDEFDDLELGLDWYFLETEAAGRYSLRANPGYMRLQPALEQTHVLQKVAEHSYTLVTEVSFDAIAADQKAGIYLTNGDQSSVIKIYSGYDEGKQIGVNYFGNLHVIDNTIGNRVWFKVEKTGHLLHVYTSVDGEVWDLLIENIDTSSLDAEQTNYNSWIGNSHGLFAEGADADFDCFRYNQKSGNIFVWLEAECGTMGSLWEISADATASNGQYVAVKNGNTSAADAPDDSSGLVDYTFRVEEGGQFYVWARLICPTANDDSFWVKMDGGAWTLWNGIAPGATEWTWDKINQPFTLSEGFHTLTVGYREDGAWVDKWGITQSDAVPEGFGSEATNCGE